MKNGKGVVIRKNRKVRPKGKFDTFYILVIFKSYAEIHVECGSSLTTMILFLEFQLTTHSSGTPFGAITCTKKLSLD